MSRKMASRAKTNSDQPPSPWIKSRAKAKLRSLLQDESSWIQCCSPEQIHAADDDFKQYPIARFKVNFNNLKASIEVDRQCVLFDEAAFKQHEEKFPRNPTTERGYKYWNKHPAEKRLHDMVKQGETSNRKPEDIRHDHPDFQDFPPSVFRQHLYQEKRRLKEGVFWQKKRNDKAHKKHRDEEERRKQNEL